MALALGALLTRSAECASWERATRSFHVDRLSNTLLLFAGLDSSGAFGNEVFFAPLSADTLRWRRLEVAGAVPPVRSEQASAYCATRHQLYVLGGIGMAADGTILGSPLADLWRLDLSGAPHWESVTPAGEGPSPRYSHTAVYDPGRDAILVYGGTNGDGEAFDELWELRLSPTPTWKKLVVDGERPPGLQGQCAVFDDAHKRMIVFGGMYADARLWVLSLSPDPHWAAAELLGPDRGAVRGRMSAASCLDASGRGLLVFGGFGDGDVCRSDLWQINLGAAPSATGMIECSARQLMPSMSPTADAGAGANGPAPRMSAAIFVPEPASKEIGWREGGGSGTECVVVAGRGLGGQERGWTARGPVRADAWALAATYPAGGGLPHCEWRTVVVDAGASATSAFPIASPEAMSKPATPGIFVVPAREAALSEYERLREKAITPTAGIVPVTGEQIWTRYVEGPFNETVAAWNGDEWKLATIPVTETPALDLIRNPEQLDADASLFTRVNVGVVMDDRIRIGGLSLFSGEWYEFTHKYTTSLTKAAHASELAPALASAHKRYATALEAWGKDIFVAKIPGIVVTEQDYDLAGGTLAVNAASIRYDDAILAVQGSGTRREGRVCRCPSEGGWDGPGISDLRQVMKIGVEDADKLITATRAKPGSVEVLYRVVRLEPCKNCEVLRPTARGEQLWVFRPVLRILGYKFDVGIPDRGHLLQPTQPSAQPAPPQPAAGAAARSQSTVSGIIQRVEPQGNNYLELGLKDASGKTIAVHCSGGRARAFRRGVAATWGDLRVGKRISATGRWIAEEGAQVFSPSRIDILD